MGYICCLGEFIEPSKSLGGGGAEYEPSEKFRGQKQTLFYLILKMLAFQLYLGEFLGSIVSNW
jgi:hypothetical protein